MHQFFFSFKIIINGEIQDTSGTIGSQTRNKIKFNLIQLITYYIMYCITNGN